ncbi:MAG: glycoside hydrolase family 97 protein [Acidobacteriota bacterium]|nr:glycoside hydrolase family 97 protein [Acidobacteriota bacterium]
MRLPCALIALLASAGLSAQTFDLTSPGGQLKMSFRTMPLVMAAGGAGRGRGGPQAAGNYLVYEVSWKGRTLIDPSPIVIDLEGTRPLGADVRIASGTPSSGEDNYHLLAGRASDVHDRYNGLALEIEDNAVPGRRIRVEARAYDSGAAFRYIVPEQRDLSAFRLTADETEFRIAKDATGYVLQLPNFDTMYESEYLKLPISALSDGRLAGLPLLMDVPGVAWLAITEADMRGNAAMYLTNPPPRGFRLKAKIPPNFTEPSIATAGTLPHHSPWRVLLVADQPSSMIATNLITDLNPPSAIADTSWIHPGKSSWDWWSGSLDPQGKPAFTTENMKTYVDFSAESGFPYMLVDAGWSAQGDVTKLNGKVDIPALVAYAKPKNVKIWIWVHWSGLNAQMEEAFATYEKWGVAGVKTDFMSRDDQTMTEFYYRTAEAAARHHLMMDFHGATKPTGMERTWPNVMGYEAVLGMEQSKWSTRDNPDNHTSLALTRMIAGMMDYTPGGFDNVTRAEFTGRNAKPMVMGTRAHELAMYAIFEAPFQMVSDYPHAYRDQPAFEFIRTAPSSWDETRGIGGDPGEYVTIARRKGNEWFLGSMTNWTPRTLDIPLSFLGPGKYTAEIFEDESDAGEHPKNVRITKQQVDGTGHLKAQMASGGGFAVHFVPVP